MSARALVGVVASTFGLLGWQPRWDGQRLTGHVLEYQREASEMGMAKGVQIFNAPIGVQCKTPHLESRYFEIIQGPLHWAWADVRFLFWPQYTFSSSDYELRVMGKWQPNREDHSFATQMIRRGIAGIPEFNLEYWGHVWPFPTETGRLNGDKRPLGSFAVCYLPLQNLSLLASIVGQYDGENCHYNSRNSSNDAIVRVEPCDSISKKLFDLIYLVAGISLVFGGFCAVLWRGQWSPIIGAILAAVGFAVAIHGGFLFTR